MNPTPVVRFILPLESIRGLHEKRLYLRLYWGLYLRLYLRIYLRLHLRLLLDVA